ncbi:galactose mutarotase [Bombilactobacillus bombi]|uniref:Galactose mutarotase n=1 Tax=Bombilactobacillus bombi TaxID=1303590 RepID=A0A417Z2A1_9LACO|nr:aldose epimerase family protein [Bombilactobacillus bombi]RHW44461.1 galactose mutarotase [Bombilactobacillus bombi]
MVVTKKQIGRTKNGNIELFTITNNHHTQINLLSYGATWQNWQVQDNNQLQSLITHYDDWTKYQESTYFAGRTVAPVAGRITKAHFQLQGQDYQMQPNENDNLLHSGTTGFQHQNFVGQAVDDHTVEFAYILQASDNYFPGTLQLRVQYQLTDSDCVQITYWGTSDVTTLFNPTCHVYFNLDQNTSINEQQLQINADQYLELTAEKVPMGQLLPVDAATDFRHSKTLASGLESIQQQTGKIEFDHVYYTPNKLVATLQTTQRAVDLYSDRDALVIYTGSPEATESDWHHYTGLAMEMQSLPDAINHPDFGDIILPAGKTISYSSSYQYRKL